MSKRNIILVLWIAGALAIAYGMLRHNNFVFIPGIVMVCIGYLMVRRHLKRPGHKGEDDKNKDNGIIR